MSEGTKEKTWEEMTRRERDGWIAKHVMPMPRPDEYVCVDDNGKSAVYLRGEGQFVIRVPDFTTQVEHDYEVLRHFRDFRLQGEAERFGQALFAIWDDRYPTERVKSGVEGFYYRPGDYSWAAFLALRETTP